MEALFEAFVAKHLQKQVSHGFVLKTQARSHYLVRHQEQDWFRMKPDLLIHDEQANRLVLEIKSKLLPFCLKNRGLLLPVVSTFRTALAFLPDCRRQRTQGDYGHEKSRSFDKKQAVSMFCSSIVSIRKQQLFEIFD